MIRRAEWGARKPKAVSRNIHPVGVAAHWTGNRQGWPFKHSQCAAKVRAIQRFHMDGRGWSDIAYNLLVCPHGFIFEGRGVGVRSAANGSSRTNTSHYAVCYLGGKGEPFTPEGARGMSEAMGLLHDGERVCHHDLNRRTACPGDGIHEWVRDGCPVDGEPMLQRGSRGPAVERVQRAVGADVDGVFGPQTEEAVKAFQKARGLAVDGIVGKHTWEAINRAENGTQSPESAIESEDERMLVRFSDRPHVYEVVGSHLEHVTAQAFNARGLSHADVKDVPAGHPLAALPRVEEE